jgi:hypothetical protein
MKLDSPEKLESPVIGLDRRWFGRSRSLLPEHTPELTEQYLSLAERHDLLITGGSVFMAKPSWRTTWVVVTAARSAGKVAGTLKQRKRD